MTNSNKIISRQTTNKDNSINLVDILKYLLFHWKWFLLSILLFGGYYFYQYSKTPFVYSTSQIVMIKTPMNTPTTARITKSNAVFNSISLSGENLQLHSKELMRQTVYRIGADISYSIRRGLRKYELYKKSPVQVKFIGDSPSRSAFTVQLVNSKSVLVRDWNGEEGTKEITVPFNKETQTPFGRIVITPSAYYSEAVNGDEIRVTKTSLEQVAKGFLNNLEIKQLEEDASLLQITLKDNSPERAADLITMLITVYNEISLKDKNKIAVSTADFIEDRLSLLEKELGDVESQIERIRTSNEGADIGTSGQMFYSETRAYQADRNKIETDKRLVEMMRSYIRNGSRQNELIPNNLGLVDANVEEQIAEYNSTLLKKNRLVEGGNSQNPVVKDLDKTLHAMRRNIDRAVDNALVGIDIKLRNVQQEEQISRSKAMQVPRKERVMLSLERQRKVKEDLYVYLLNKSEENALNQAMTDDNVRIVDPASGSNAPIHPSLVKKLMVGVGLGTAFPAIILLSILMLNTKVHNRQEVQEVLTVPFLGEIPYAKSLPSAGNSIIVTKNGRGTLTEMFRILRTNIGFMAKDGVVPQVITLTSFSAGAGKTFTALNLAATFSYLDKKVVILDLDLRKGTMSSLNGVASATGVSHYLADAKILVDDILMKIEGQSNLDLIPIGVIAPNPVELLLSKRLDELINELKKRYDYIFVDGVPAGVVADASIVDRISDLTLFIIRAGKMDRRSLPEIEDIYEEEKLTNLAIVLNGIKLGSIGYGYGGYGYGYGEPKKKNLIQRWFRI